MGWRRESGQQGNSNKPQAVQAPENCTMSLPVDASVAKPADADRAFALLRQAIRDGFADPRTLGADPDLAPIRTRPEFTALTNALKDITR